MSLGDTAVPSAEPPAGDLPAPKTYVSCLSSPLSSPTKDRKPKNSAHHISLAPCPPPAAPLRELLDKAGGPGEEATRVPCVFDGGQAVPGGDSAVTSGQHSDSASNSGLEDCCPETAPSPRGEAATPPLPESTVPISNGVLKGELSDLGTEDGWTVDAEADHSGGRQAWGVPLIQLGKVLVSLCCFCSHNALPHCVPAACRNRGTVESWWATEK